MTTRRVRGRLVFSALFATLSLLDARPGAATLCGDWDTVATPNVGDRHNFLTDVTALSANDAWSVGVWRNQVAGRGPLVLHWNGAAWGGIALPETSQLGSYPETEGVDAAPNGDVWLVGNVSTGYPTYNLPLAVRWANGSWQSVGTIPLRPQNVYPFASRGGLAYEVDALAANDVWVVGQAAGLGTGATTVPLVAHWDGSSWTDMDVPTLANRHHELQGVVAIAHDDAWVVGNYRNEPGAFKGVTYHWDGSTWSHVDSPIEQMGGDSGLEDVVATGPNDVWAIGNSQQIGVTVMHWDGAEWSLTASPPNSGASLAAVGPNDLWASGWNGFWHWDGIGWTEVLSSVSGASYVLRNGGMSIVGGCDIWSVGYWTLADGTTSFTLAERLHASDPPPSAVDTPSAGSVALTVANPYRSGDPIQLALPAGKPTLLTVHDLQGAEVRRLFESSSPGRAQSVVWNGRSDAGRALPTGVYFLRLDVGGTRTSRKLLFLGGRE